MERTLTGMIWISCASLSPVLTSTPTEAAVSRSITTESTGSATRTLSICITMAPTGCVAGDSLIPDDGWLSCPSAAETECKLLTQGE